MPTRSTALLIAVLLPMLLFRWFAPTLTWQLDFWILWLVAMSLVGLPLLYAEGALAIRSRQYALPVQGIQSLTREADKSAVWRSFAWLALLLLFVLVVFSVDSAANQMVLSLSSLDVSLDVPTFAVSAALVVVAGIFSLLGRKLLLPAVALIGLSIVVGLVLGVAQFNPSFGLQLTAVSLTEWAVAVLLALVCVGAGTGLYWYSYPHDGDLKPNMTQKVMPIWLTQLGVGAVLLFISNVFITALYSKAVIPSVLFALGLLLSAAYFIHYVSEQLGTVFRRFGMMIATVVVTMLAAVGAALTDPKSQIVLLSLVSLVCALELAIFSGWKMKISHLRKSLNFASETRYNIWRIIIRIITPLCIVTAIAAIILGWIS